MQLTLSLKHRPFALLWAGQAISRLGDALYRIALAWWVVQKTGSAEVMGAVLIASFVPMLIFLLIGGVAADRIPRVQLMIVSDLLRGFLVILVAALAASDRLEVWHIIVLSIIFGFISAFFQPAYAALLPEITPKDLLKSANSLTVLSGQASTILGPMIGAFIVKVGGTHVAFLLNGVSFVLAVIFLLPLLGFMPHIEAPEKTKRGKPGVLQDLKEGFGLVAAIPWLWITILLFGLTNVTLSGPLSISLPFLINDSFNADVDMLGIVFAMQGVGAVIGSLLLGNAKTVHRRGLLAYGGTIVAGIAIALMGLPITFVGLWIAALAIGVGMTVFSLIWTNTLQEMVPLEKLGRVVSIDQLGSFALLPIGYGIAGKLTSDWGAAAVFLVGGLSTILLLGLGLLHPAIRHLD